MTIEIFALALIAIACLVVWGCFFVMLWQRRPENPKPNPKPNPKSGASRPPCGEQDGEGDFVFDIETGAQTPKEAEDL